LHSVFELCKDKLDHLHSAQLEHMAMAVKRSESAW
jgi:hypothetical protein